MSQSGIPFWGSVQVIGVLIVLLGLALIVWLHRRAQRKKPTLVAAQDLVAGGILLLLTVGFFWRTLSGDVYQPADGGDLVSFLYPTYRFAAEQVRQWTLPLWNPHLYGGAPFISDIQAGFLYPPNVLLFLLWPHFPYTVMQWLTIGHLYWAGLGMYLLLRTWHWQPEQPLSRPAALFGALAFAFSDPLLIHLGNLNLIAVLSWLPWCLAAYHQALIGRSYRWTALAALLFAISTYAGHAQSTFYVAIAVALYTLGYWMAGVSKGAFLWKAQGQEVGGREEGTGNKFVTTCLLPLLFYLLAVLLTAPIILPALELTAFTERSAFTYQDTVAFSLAPTQAIGLLTPGFFGRGPALHWSLWARVETPYAGVATVVLAVGTLLLADQAVRRRLLPWMIMALFGFVTALGIYAIVHGWLTALLPLFGQFRAPARALVLWTLGVAVLGAVGVDVTSVTLSKRTFQGLDPQSAGWRHMQTLLSRGALILLGVVTPLSYFALLVTQESETAFLRASVAALALTLLLFFWLGVWAILALQWSGWLNARGQGIALVGLLFFDLAATGAYTDISPSDPTAGFVHPAIVDFLRQEATEPYRIDSLTDIHDLWQPDAAALYGLQDVGGIANPLMLDHWRALWAALDGRQTALYDMLNVKYVLVRDGTPLPEGKFELAFDAPGPLALYRNTTALPRAWLVHEAVTVSSNAEALAAVGSTSFDPRRQAVLLTSTSPPLASSTNPETVAITHYGSNDITLTVAASAPALLVLSEIWYPGWRATVNGVVVPVLQANGALRAVPVPAGTATVALRFAPFSCRLGLAAFAFGCSLLLVLLSWRRFSMRWRLTVEASQPS